MACVLAKEGPIKNRAGRHLRGFVHLAKTMAIVVIVTISANQFNLDLTICN